MAMTTYKIVSIALGVRLTTGSFGRAIWFSEFCGIIPIVMETSKANVETKPESKFKVGDRIQVIESKREYLLRCDDGSLQDYRGVVLSDQSEFYQMDQGKNGYEVLTDDGEPADLLEDEMELENAN